MKHGTFVKFGTTPGTRRHHVYAQVEELKTKPGEWAVIRTYPREQQRAAHNYASHIARGRFPAFKGCDAVARTVGDIVEVRAAWKGGTDE